MYKVLEVALIIQDAKNIIFCHYNIEYINKVITNLISV